MILKAPLMRGFFLAGVSLTVSRCREMLLLGLFRNYMWRVLFLGMAACAMLLSGACSKDKPEHKVQPALESARSLHHLAKMWELMYLTVSGQASAILPDGMRVIWVDSTMADWDGMEFYLDFGKRSKSNPRGKLCRDGYYRSGIYRASLGGENWTSGLYLALIMQGKDSCTMSKGKNLYRFEGRVHIQVKQNQESVVQAAFTTADNTLKTWLEADAAVQMMAGNTTSVPPYVLTGNGSLRSEQWQVLWQTAGLVKAAEEQICFSTGELKVWGNTEQYRVDFDPYGNEANDLWMKVWQGRREILFELD